MYKIVWIVNDFWKWKLYNNKSNCSRKNEEKTMKKS